MGEEFIWTAAQRRGVMALLSLILLVLGARYWMNRSVVGDPMPAEGNRFGELITRVDPNTADVPTLAAVPGIGPKMAERIVEERDEYHTKHPDGAAFERVEDLMRVKGIGQATTRNVEPYLIFPNRPEERE